MRTALKDDPRLRFFIGDVRDQERLQRAMDGIELVVHAAALKRIETVEYNILEAVATNVVGTRNVVLACINAGVKRAVLLSTDKACAATTTYGMTKALAERIFLQSSVYAPEGTKFAVCRYGNLLKSTGSVVPIWQKMIADGATELPVTDLDCSRFHMTLAQAIDLVWQTALTMKGGELVIPELPAYRLGDLVEAFGVRPRVTGLANGEKLHESLAEGVTSDKAPRMTVEALRLALMADPVWLGQHGA